MVEYGEAGYFTLRLAASVRAVDEESVTFPPVALKSKKEVKGRVLVAPLSALTRDSDGDGLTDLVEDRLLLDPHSADTDGDGIPDGKDLLPQVPTTKDHPGVRAELISALLFELSGHRQPAALVTGLPAARPSQPAFRLEGPAPTSFEDLRFLAAIRADLPGIQTLGAAIAFDEEELALASKRFGAFYPLSIDVFVSAKGDRALLVWDEGWRGGSFLAMLKDGHWVLTDRGGWVT